MPSHFHRPRDERLVVGVAGRIGAGKTSVARYLSSSYKFRYIRYSRVLAEWLAKDPDSKPNLQEIGWEVMAGGMQTELNRRLIAQIMSNADVAVDGLRHPIDCESLRNSFLSSFHLLYIDSPLEDRRERLRARGRYTSLDSFKAADSHPVEQQIELLRASAPLVIQNKSSLQDLYVAVDDAIREFRKEGPA